ncbi:MAG: hypothetical protein FWD05_12995, partial [Oscillospiraceae bacterium]|nr:hypothetical protein [Oscillospiraceae bacterium]
GLWVGQGQIGGNLPSHVTILGGEIYGNSANQGGGASVGQGGSLTIDLYGSSIHSNESTNNGGGVWVSGTGGAFRSTLRLIRGSIENNTAANSGGGVFVGVGGIFNMDDGNDRTTIENNHAQQGGGVHVEGGNFNMYGGAIRNNRYDASGQVIARGGGVSLGNVLQNVVHFNMTGGEISNNTANEGGGIRINGSAPNSTFNITGGTIKNNDAIGTGVTHGGGGLWISVNARVNMMDTDIIGNSATDALNGGGVWIGRSNGGSAANAVDRGTLTMTGGTITGNIANGDGGGVWVGGNGAEFTMTDVAIDEDNTATNGGGVWVGGWVSGTGQNMTNPVRLTMNGESSISGNIATGVYADNGGGGVYVSGENARFDMNSGRIDGNRAFRGGGIHILGNAIFSGTAGAITNNIATDDGGGMYVHYIFPDNLTNLNGVTIVPAFTFSNNEALNGLGINNELGLAQRPRIDPNIVTLSGEIIIDRVPANSETFATIRPHAFTNHDINAEGTMWRVTHEIRRGYVEGQTEISAIVGTNNHLVPSGALLPDGAIVTFNALPEEYFEYWRITTRPREVDEQGNPVDYTFLRNETDHNFPQAITAHTHVAANFISDSILTISKEVTGELANLTLEFLFTLYITDADGELLPTGTEFDFTGGVVDNINAIAPPDGVLTVNDYGIIEFWLGHGQSKSIDNIPVHLYVRVVESPHPGYEASFMDTEYYGVDVPGNDTGTRPMVAEREFNFTNDRFVPPPTGLSSDNTGVVLLLSTLVLLVGVATFAINKKSKLARNVNINLK